MKLQAVTLLVPDYDAGIDFYVNKVGFALLEDTMLSATKRWVRISAGEGSDLLLAQPSTPEQAAAMGRQTGGRVGFFLESVDFDADHARMLAAGILFEETPRSEAYGRVAVWRDPFGNRWDLVQFTR